MYLLYRWVLALFYTVYLFFAGLENGVHFFVFYSFWALLIHAVYLIWCASSSTVDYFKYNFCCPEDKQPSVYLEHQPPGCCGKKIDNLKWYHKVLWVLFTVAIDSALAVVLTYWVLIYSPQNNIDDVFGHINVVVHVLVCVTALLDIVVTGIPVRFYHLIYSVLAIAVFIVFTAVYNVADGGNNIDNGTYIYVALDYDNNPGTASAYAVLYPIVVFPIFHTITYIIYIIREALLYCVRKKCCKCCAEAIEQDNKIELQDF